MKHRAILLYPVYISRNREFIKNRTNAFPRARCHQDKLISRNLLRCCKTPASSFTMYHDTQRLHTGQFSVIHYVTKVTVYRIFTLSAFIELLGIFYLIVVGSCLNRHTFIHLNLLNTANKLSVLHEIDCRLLSGSPQGQEFLLCATQIMVKYFFHSAQLLGLLCSDFCPQYGLSYI